MQNIVLEWMIYGLLFAGLILETAIDIRKQKIWIPAILVEVLLLSGLNYLLGKGGLLLWIVSIGTGAVFYFISVVTRGQIGKGDAFLFVMTGSGMGVVGNIKLIYLTFFIAFFAAAFLWLIKKTRKDYRMPLAPFVLTSFCLLMAEKLLYVFL